MRDQDLKSFSEEVKKGFQEALGYKRFNRHEVFSMEDTSFVLQLISQVRDHSIKNMLYGLFDGYLYQELMYDLYSKTDVKGDDLLRLERIISKIEVHIEMNGQTETNI
jgi:hypothetical protein